MKIEVEGEGGSTLMAAYLMAKPLTEVAKGIRSSIVHRIRIYKILLRKKNAAQTMSIHCMTVAIADTSKSDILVLAQYYQQPRRAAGFS